MNLARTSKLMHLLPPRLNLTKAKTVCVQMSVDINNLISASYISPPCLQKIITKKGPDNDFQNKHISCKPSFFQINMPKPQLYSFCTCVSSKPVKKTKIRLDRVKNQSLFRSLISEKGEVPLNEDDWIHISETLTSNLKDKWDIFCMHTLYLDHNVTAAKSMIGYLKSKGMELDCVVLTFYVGLLGETAADSVEQENELKLYFDILNKKTEVFDAASIEILISALSKTKLYLQCLPLIEMYKEFSIVGSGIVLNLLKAGLKYNDFEIIDNAFSEMNFRDVDASQITASIPQLVESCLRSENMKGLELLMNFMRTHFLLVSKPGLEQIIELFNRYQPHRWTMKYGNIHDKRKVCTVCRTRMQEIKLNDEEFLSLQKAFLQQVIVGQNVFYKSTPAEIENITKFIKARAPFDVVVDGLNILFKGYGGPLKSKLESVLQHFLEQDKKILLLGSKMIKHYLPPVKKSHLLHVFMSDSTKADDVFYLYAALYSGKDCIIVTADKLRDHKFLLKKELRPLFHKWLRSVQIHHWILDKNNKFNILRRDNFETGPIKDDGGWHIPLNDVDKTFRFGNLGVLCLRHKNTTLPHDQ